MADGFQLFDDGGKEDFSHLTTFLEEMEETLGNLENILIDLETRSGNSDLINHCFRLFHNLKGSAGMMECVITKEVAHYAESLLDLVRNGTVQLNSAHIDLFLEALSSLKEIRGRLVKSGREGDERYFPLLTKLVDAARQLPEDNTEKASDGNKDKKKTGESSKSNDNDQVKVSRGTIEQMMLLVGEFMQLKNKIHWLKQKFNDRQYYDNCQELDQFSSKLQRTILKLRLSPVKPIFHSMRRVVRTTANQTGKKIDFSIKGEDTLLDRSILDAIGDPLMHLLRNAIDHGIESAERRQIANKPTNGSVALEAVYKAGEVHVSVSDDGKGLDPELLKRKAVAKGLLTETQIQSMSLAEAHQIVFLPGFSGAEQVTETSGRGVGLDVVKEGISSVGGQVDIQTDIGSGTTFIIKLPLSLAIVECLGFRVGDQTYAIPQLNVEEVLSTNSSFVQQNLRRLENGSEVFMVRESPAPVLNLGAVLCKEGSRSEALIQVRHGKHRFVLKVCNIVGALSIVSQPLPPTFSQDTPFSGVTKQGDGSLLFQLDISRLFLHVEAISTEVKKKRSANRGVAGESQEGSLLTSSDITRLQQKTIVFRSGLTFCLPVQRAKRIVFIRGEQIKEVGEGGKSFVTLEGQTIPLIWVEEKLLRQKRKRQDSYSLLIFQHRDSAMFGIPMTEFMGIERMPENYDTEVAEPGILGSTVINKETCLSLDLPALVAMYLGRDSAKELEGKESTKRKRILCAEDDKFFASELTATLTGAGYEVIMCEDGLIAKGRLIDPDFVDSLDLVITDIEMPNMTGLALCRWIKSTDHAAKLPVISYTAITTEEMRRKMMEAGSIAFISKMALDNLIETVGQLFAGKSLNGGSEGEVSTKATTLDRVVTFQLGQDWYALPMDCIKEVSPVGNSADVPHAPDWIGRITAFRGQMIPVMDLQKYFDYESFVDNSEQAVIDSGDVVFGLKVGRIGEVIVKSQLHVGDGLPNYGPKQARITPYVANVYHFQDRIISLINPAKLSLLCKDFREKIIREERVA